MLDIDTHLSWWGLRQFTSDAPYFEWQRSVVHPSDIAELHRLQELKRTSRLDVDEVAFYDYSARPEVLPGIHSERYDYYRVVGTAIADRIMGAKHVLDFGCGPGILTTFHARLFPDSTFVGIDRSQACVEMAQRQASALGLTNVRFECRDIADTRIPDGYDLIISVQALLQAETDPGIPSLSWHTFDRGHDPVQQSAFEERTGLKLRLDRLCSLLAPGGRFLLFEKTGHLARRIPFQRALASHELRLLEPALPLTYTLLDERVEDGPLYAVVRRSDQGMPDSPIAWNEAPALLPDEEVFRCRGAAARLVWERLPERIVTEQSDALHQTMGPIRLEQGSAGRGLAYFFLSASNRFQGVLIGGQGTHAILASCFADAANLISENPGQVTTFLEAQWPETQTQAEPSHLPLYENHSAAAQHVWSCLPERRVLRELTNHKADGREVHIEIGTSGELTYVYCANTFDQRQLVIFEPQRAHFLEDYYQELCDTQPADSR